MSAVYALYLDPDAAQRMEQDAPLGTPVEPDVKMTHASSAGVGGAASPASPASPTPPIFRR